MYSNVPYITLVHVHVTLYPFHVPYTRLKVATCAFTVNCNKSFHYSVPISRPARLPAYAYLYPSWLLHAHVAPVPHFSGVSHLPGASLLGGIPPCKLLGTCSFSFPRPPAHNLPLPCERTSTTARASLFEGPYSTILPCA